MWKTISFRRPLRKQTDIGGKAPPRQTSGAKDGPFADLMTKLDRIPYRRTWRRATDL